MAVFFALVVKKPDKGEFEVTEEALKLAEDEEFLQQTSANPNEARSKKPKLLPPDQARLIAMRSARMKERKMYSVIREIVTFYVFLVLLLMIAYTHRDKMAFHQTKNLFDEMGSRFSNVSSIDPSHRLHYCATSEVYISRPVLRLEKAESRITNLHLQ